MPRIGRLEAALMMSMTGCIADFAITHWMINHLTGYAESNQNLLPALGVPLLVMNLVLADKILPKRITFDRAIYTMALLQWTGPVQNALVLFKVVDGLNYFSVVLPSIVAIYIGLCLVPVIKIRLRWMTPQRQA